MNAAAGDDDRPLRPGERLDSSLDVGGVRLDARRRGCLLDLDVGFFVQHVRRKIQVAWPGPHRLRALQGSGHHRRDLMDVAD
ncbi:MAG: hypothetical protein R2849_01035 [Thermomicrobiales bacterium]